mmetsp:Transcript_12647/g.30864  ORF Transcript_12647/g.30864 Transcript_12647/m.30864 type:complete len:239 (+) Transcript_12647:421-1137(+)
MLRHRVVMLRENLAQAWLHPKIPLSLGLLLVFHGIFVASSTRTFGRSIYLPRMNIILCAYWRVVCIFNPQYHCLVLSPHPQPLQDNNCRPTRARHRRVGTHLPSRVSSFHLTMDFPCTLQGHLYCPRRCRRCQSSLSLPRKHRSAPSSAPPTPAWRDPPIFPMPPRPRLPRRASPARTARRPPRTPRKLPRWRPSMPSWWIRAIAAPASSSTRPSCTIPRRIRSWIPLTSRMGSCGDF